MNYSTSFQTPVSLSNTRLPRLRDGTRTDGSAGRTPNGGGFTLTKVGTGEITFRPQTVSNLAAVNINAGTLKFEGFDGP